MAHRHRSNNGFQLFDERDSNSDSDDSFGSGSSSQDFTSSRPPEVWVFGYGSLCWYPGFEYNKCITGYIRGYIRRFWQGNVTHRGTNDNPGRVATLVEEKNGITWGCAYKITGSTALNYLKHRECSLGGYITLYTKFYPRVASDDAELSGEAFPSLLYIATDRNHLWLGDAPLENIAEQIVSSRGPSGHNVEYLLRLAQFMREELNLVDTHDEHLFELERLVIAKISERKICMFSLMGPAPDRIQRDSHEEVRRPATFEFTSRVPDKRLRCLNI